LFIVAVILRIPGILQDFPPFTFGDEDIITMTAYQMYREGTLVPKTFLCGGVNFYLPILLANVCDFFMDRVLTFSEFLLVTRMTMPVILGSCIPIIVYFTCLRVFQRTSMAAITGILSLFSPMLLAINRIVYPDHYIAFFSAFFFYFCFGILTALSE